MLEQFFVASQFLGIIAGHADDGAFHFGGRVENMFADGKDEFDRKGEWTDIDCKYSAVPTGIIPAPIAKYVADNYPDNKIVQIERDTRSTEVKLDNRMEIKFDKQHRVIEMDF